MKPTTAKSIVTIIALLVIILRIVFFAPQNPLDTTNLVILGFIVAIWFGQVIFKSIALPGGLAVEFREDNNIKAEAKAKVEKELKQTQQPAINWDKVATLFWLGNDLMWIEDMHVLNECLKALKMHFDIWKIWALPLIPFQSRS